MLKNFPFQNFPVHGELQAVPASLPWLVVSIPLKHMKVSWDDDIPNIWKVIIQLCSSHHQPDILVFQLLTLINHRLTRKIPWFQSPPTVVIMNFTLNSHPISPAFWKQRSSPPGRLGNAPSSSHLTLRHWGDLFRIPPKNTTVGWFRIYTLDYIILIGMLSIIK